MPCVDVFENLWGATLLPEPGLRIPNMFDAALDGTFRGLYVQGEDIAQSDPNIARHRRTERDGVVVVQDLFLNETAKFAHVFLPGSRSWRRTARSPTQSAGSTGCGR